MASNGWTGNTRSHTPGTEPRGGGFPQPWRVSLWNPILPACSRRPRTRQTHKHVRLRTHGHVRVWAVPMGARVVFGQHPHDSLHPLFSSIFCPRLGHWTEYPPSFLLHSGRAPRFKPQAQNLLFHVVCGFSPTSLLLQRLLMPCHARPHYHERGRKKTEIFLKRRRRNRTEACVCLSPPLSFQAECVVGGEGGNLAGAAKGGVARAALLDDVTQQRLLAVIGGEDADFLGRVPPQPHVLVAAHHQLRLPQVLLAPQHTLSLNLPLCSPPRRYMINN